MKIGILLLAVVVVLGLTSAHAQDVNFADIKCFVLTETTMEGSVPFHMKDRTGMQIDGFISKEPFLTTKHFLLPGVTLGKSVVGPKKGKSILIVPLTDEGRMVLEHYTEEYVRRRVAIFTGTELASVPVIQEKFSGPLPIEGGYSDEEARHIVTVFKASK